MAEDLNVFAERVALRAQSLLELLPDEEFEEGVRQMREEAARTTASPVVDSYECFLFRLR